MFRNLNILRAAKTNYEIALLINCKNSAKWTVIQIYMLKSKHPEDEQQLCYFLLLNTYRLHNLKIILLRLVKYDH